MNKLKSIVNQFYSNNVISESVNISGRILLIIVFALISFTITFVSYVENPTGDEHRYLEFANNLTHGFYTVSSNINLWNGPGYPLFLAFFKLIGFQKLHLALLNPLLLTLTLFNLMRTVGIHHSNRFAIVFGVLFCLYVPMYSFLPKLLTEILTLYIITSLTYHIYKYTTNKKKKDLVLFGFYLGFLVLVKIIFWYVLIGVIIISILYFLIRKNSSLIISSGIAIIIVLPYLFYTYGLTSKVGYIGNSGGLSLYWMSTPYEKEYGDWHNYTFNDHQKLKNSDVIRSNHEEDYSRILKLNSIQRDQEFKKVAKKNIINNPLKYAKNISMNLGRLLLDSPKSYYYENGGFMKYFQNLFLFVIFLFIVGVNLLKWKRLVLTNALPLIIISLYLGLSLLVSSYARMFIVCVPVILLSLSYCTKSILKIDITFRN